MSNTAEQDACIHKLLGPVDVSAGAGSGKTYTLTQRIAYAFEQEENGVSSIDEVCAITFTNKAAAELKSRIRGILRERGRFEEALKVDNAWISTIHGMCSRILRASALELGYDPAFSLIDGPELDALRSAAIEAALQEYHEGANAEERAVLKEMELCLGVRPKQGSFNDASVQTCIANLMNQAAMLPNGYADMYLLECEADLSADVRTLYVLALELREVLVYEKETTYASKNMRVLDANELALSNYYAKGDSSQDAALNVLVSLSKLRKYGNDLQKASIVEFNQQLEMAKFNVLCAKATQFMKCLLVLAERADVLFTQFKRERSAMDNNDLVKGAYWALQNPSIRKQYENRFRMVMVDEFQDTDALQLGIIDCISGENRKYLCTVGDAQQSIYAFRGADISVYRAYRATYTGALEHNKLLLTKNFRSHADVLAFVKAVCQQASVFGSEFLDLSAGKAQFKTVDVARVQVHLCVAKKAEQRMQGTTEAIVAYFSEMRNAGFKLSDMVLLLGRMSHAEAYAQALQQAGFECVIAGGSLFTKTAEAQSVAALCRFLVNPKDSEALVCALTSPFFGLTAQDLLCFASKQVNDTLVKQSISAGFLAALARINAGETWLCSPQGVPFCSDIMHLLFMLNKALMALRTAPLSRVVEQVLLDCGWLAAMQECGPVGSASLGNAYKALRMLQKLESSGKNGQVSVALCYQNMIDSGLAEAPGALNVEKQESISIMTIHASKGLEFPVVAVADFDKESKTSTGVLYSKYDGNPCACLHLSRFKRSKGEPIEASNPASGEVEMPKSFEEFKALSCAKQRAALSQNAYKAEYEETQRLFYVAATRAEACLGIFASASIKKEGIVATGVSGEVVRAFFGNDPLDGNLSEGVTQFVLESGAHMPFYVRVCSTEEPGSGGCDEQSAAKASSSASAGEGFGKTEYEPNEGCREFDEADDEAQCEQIREVLGEAIPQEVRVLPVIDPMPEMQLVYTEHTVLDAKLFSYSSISHEVDDDARRPLTALSNAHAVVAPRTVVGALEADDAALEANEQTATAFLRGADADKATSFGSALHRLCQIAALRTAQSARDAVEAMAQTYGVHDCARLRAALERWLSSHVAQQAFAYPQRFAEYPFCVQVGEHVMEGEIDLLCVETLPNAEKKAFVVDYKTGGYDAETADQLCNKHVLQATCYAYAVLLQGFSQVDFAFVRVERDDPSGADTLQKVEYHFTSADLPTITESICSILG